MANTLTDNDDLWVSGDKFVAEPVLWCLDVMTGRLVAISWDGVPFAAFRPEPTTLRSHSRTGSVHSGAENDDEETPS